MAGVSRVSLREGREGRESRATTAILSFIVESQQGQHIRPQLARMIVESGWNLNELHGVGLSLEEIFLELTGAPKHDVEFAHATTVELAEGDAAPTGATTSGNSAAGEN